MNFSPQVKSWIILIATVIGTGGAVGVTSFLGGANVWVSVIVGLTTGATNVLHALMSSPNEKSDQPINKP